MEYMPLVIPSAQWDYFEEFSILKVHYFAPVQLVIEPTGERRSCLLVTTERFLFLTSNTCAYFFLTLFYFSFDQIFFPLLVCLPPTHSSPSLQKCVNETRLSLNKHGEPGAVEKMCSCPIPKINPR